MEIGHPLPHVACIELDTLLDLSRRVHAGLHARLAYLYIVSAGIRHTGIHLSKARNWFEDLLEHKRLPSKRTSKGIPET